MKKFTKFITVVILTILSVGVYAQETCSGFYYITSNAGWSESEYYKIIDIDAANLTDAALPKFTASDGAKNAIDTDFKSGSFNTPVMTTEDGVNYVPTTVNWPVKYYLAAFAPTMYTSAWSKINLIGSNPSGTGTYQSCTFNDNSVKTSAIFAKPGFIELCRLPSEILDTPPSRHGYIQIDNLPQVERIQWSYSSTSWKRGVKADINYNDGNGWMPLRWLASDYSFWEATFSEQGYQFEEMINKQDDPDSKISVRFRIWDGDSIHYKVNANDLSLQTTTYTATMRPLAQYQTVRIHQIKVFSNVIPTEGPSAVRNVNESPIKISLSGRNIILSEEAQVNVYTYDGRNVFFGVVKNIDMSGYMKGTYIVKAIDSNGLLLNRKIIL